MKVLTKTARISLVGAIAVVIGATVLPTTASAADAISFGDQGQSATFGANAIVRIDGSITYDSNCPEPGIDDFFYPATDVYIVPAGVAAFGELSDAGGGRPNTIVSGASMFVDEVIAVTAPAGQLDEGEYDVVYDTCQDGTYDPGRDTVFPNAITVALPEVLPLADAAITALKDEARQEYYSWVATRFAMKGLFKLADRAIKTQCTVGNTVACAMKRVDYFGGIKERFLGLLLSEANHYLAIAEDPPDPNFETLTELGPIDIPVDHSDSALGNAVADAIRPLAGEAAINAALLDAVERYQGAQAAGDAEWALIHARQARNLAATLHAVVPATDGALAALKDASGTVTELDTQLTAARQFVSRVTTVGLTPDERRTLANQGRTPGEIVAMETELRSDGTDLGLDATGLFAALDQARAARPATAAAAAESAAEWNQIVIALESELSGATPHPSVDAGGPYFGDEGAAITLAGTATGTVDSAAWDLDSDGEFDDAAGFAPTISIASAGVHVIGLRVTANGHGAVSYAVVTVNDVNHPPAVSSASPAARGATVQVGTSQSFSIAASDSNGDAVNYGWTLDGSAVGGAGSSWSYVPSFAEVGEHVVEVVVADGTATGGGTRRAWTVQVIAGDADGDGWTATPDCDDADPAVHPSANELIGNGIDDDCDPGTPDAPPGGLTGSVWSWGSNHNGTVGNGTGTPTLVHSPVPISPYTDVVDVTIGDRAEYVVRANGEMRDWGFNLAGNLGNGNQSTTPIHQSPLPVGGGSGTLSGITQVSASMHVLALRTDGSVVAWAENQARQVGDGSTVTYRLYPVQVLTSPSGPPLTGVQSVHAGYMESYAVMNDGTVTAWGQIRCDGGNSIHIEPFPTTLPLVGGDVRQVSSGNQWTMILKKDGTVLSCGAVQPIAGRPVSGTDIYVPKPVTGLGAGSGVVDIAAGYEGGLALKADGTVWAWGKNANGSLNVIGVPGNGNAPVPVQVPLPPGPPVVDIEMHGACHALALRADGSLLSWGCDFFGQGGDGADPTDAIIDTPTVLELPGASVVKISNSSWNSLVITRPVADTGWERPATWVEASVGDTSVDESGGQFTVELSNAIQQAVTVQWSLVEGTASAGDIALDGGTATIPAGATSVDVPVPVVNDSLDEDDETFTIVLDDISHGIQFARSQATGTIVDDDDPPSISVESVSIVEGNTSLTDATVSVTLSTPSAKPVSVAFATLDAEAGPDDYQPTSGRLEFAPGQQHADVHVAVRGDHVAEPAETLSLLLSDPEHATLGQSSAVVTIADDEPLTLSVTSPQVPEGNAGTTAATFTVAVEPAPPAGTTVSVDFAISGVTAAVPGDVSPATGTLVFGPGAEPQSVTTDVIGDLEPEHDEAFRLVLTNVAASDGRLVLPGDNTVAAIVDDDVDDGGGGGGGGGGEDPPPSDSIAPVTTATTDAESSDSGWYRQGVLVTLAATDDGGSGVQDITYQLTGAQSGGETTPGAEAHIAIGAEGETTVTYYARDLAGNVESVRTLVIRIDSSAPNLSCAASPQVLWPPNHQLVPITVAVDVDDASSGSAGFTLMAVTSSEPDDALGDGDGTTTGDIQGFDVGSADPAGSLRAERAGTGPGRIYTLTYVARDGAANESTCTATITVPHQNSDKGSR